MIELRALVRHARQLQVSSIFDLLGESLRWQSRHLDALIRAMTLAVQTEIHELQAKLQDREEELGAAREARRQLMGQLNKRGQR